MTRLASGLARLQRLDRRLVYLALALVLAAPYVVNYTLPIRADSYTRLMFDTIERIAADPVEREKTILLLTNWGPGSEGENGPQIQALFQHLLRRRLRFLLVSTGIDPVPIAVAEVRLAQAMRGERRRAAQRGEPPPAWVYGEDYLIAYRPAQVFEPITRTLVLETRAFFERDFVRKQPLSEENFPLMAHFRGTDDISLLLAVTPGDEPRALCGIAQRQRPDLKVAVATMGIVANDLYPYVKSGQLSGLLNSARAAAEYFSLLDPQDPNTTPADNSMSMGKVFLLALVVLGNLAYVLTRAVQRGRAPAAPRGPLPPLPRRLMRGIFAAFLVLVGGVVVTELVRDLRTGSVPRPRAVRPDDDPLRDYPRFERIDPAGLASELPPAPRESPAQHARRAQGEFARLVETRVGEFLAALLTLGIFSFLLGDNGFYRVTEAFMVGGALAFLLAETWDKFLGPLWFGPIVAGLQDPAQRAGLAWLLLVVPGALWYFVYSRKYRWLNQLVVAAFIGFAIGPEFGKQAGLMVPQILDTIRPVWPLTHDAAGQLVLAPQRIEHLVFVTVLVLSLLYFVFSLRPRSRAGQRVLHAGRLAMMIGFGAMFGNTVNTRLSWLAPRIGFLLEDWLGKLGAP